MSYCVNCGVELAESEKCCPLCDTEVVNPRSPWKESSERPYPQKLETIMRRIDRRYAASLICTFVTIPVLVTMLCDLLAGGGLTWSVYVIGAGLMLLVWVALPLFARSYRILTFLALDGLAVMLYLLSLELFTNQSWFFPLGLPLSLSATVMLLALAYLFRKRWGRRLLNRLSLLLIAAGLFTIIVEIAVDLFAHGYVFLNWSPFALIPCAVLAVASQIVEHQSNFKEEIRKRMFY